MDSIYHAHTLEQVCPTHRQGERSTSSMPSGYSNTFPKRSIPADPSTLPPRYTAQEDLPLPEEDVLPPYTCTLKHGGVVAILTEMSTPFVEDTEQAWHSCYAILTGTHLQIYKLKSVGLFSVKEPVPNMSRLIRSYTLQHAEVGLALDYRQHDPVPRSTIAKLTPASMRHKLFTTDPALFEPHREWCVRLRVDTEQLLLCASTEDEMLEWVEKISHGIDLAPALDERSEPSYRSVPRRNRRQRRLEALAHRGHAGQQRAQREEDPAQRLIEQQERLFRRLYPHLLSGSIEAAELESPSRSEHQRVADEREDENTTSDLRDPEEHDLTQTTSRQDSGLDLTSSISAERTISRLSRASYDPKTAVHPERSAASFTRYRRRCAPVLLLQAPRCSDIVMHKGQRMRLDMQDLSLTPFQQDPPRYTDATPATSQSTSDDALECHLRRPSMSRNTSEMSQASTSSSTSIAIDDEIDVITATRLSQLSTISTVLSATPTLEKTKSLVTLSSLNSTAKQSGLAVGGLRSFREKLLRRQKSVRFGEPQSPASRSTVTLAPVFV